MEDDSGVLTREEKGGSLNRQVRVGRGEARPSTRRNLDINAAVRRSYLGRRACGREGTGRTSGHGGARPAGPARAVA
jgi:hypothetical protein